MIAASLLLASLLQAATPPPEPESPPGEAPAGPLDFDLFAGAPPPETAPVDDAAVSRRRTMLKLHQGLGIGTLGLTGTTVVLGALNVSDLYGDGGSHTGRYLLAHRLAAYTTLAAFASTAALSLLAPEPYQKRAGGVDTATLHKIAVGIASAGMAAQLGLGFVAARRAEAGNPRQLRRIVELHEIAGYTTLTALGLAGAVWIF
jgi:hypothetical protein